MEKDMDRTHYKTYRPRTILNTHKHCDGGWFWDKYSAFPYIGCEWGCEYCYWRDEKYNPHKASQDPRVSEFHDPFSEYIKVKENAPQLLQKALENKPRDLVYLDNYQPVDSRYHYTRRMVEVCLDLGFPIFINEKSPMLLRDLDILMKINKKSYLNIGWSIITTKDDQIRSIFEPKAPSVAARFTAMRKLSTNNIMTGTVFMPILPFIYDDEENIEAVISKTRACGGQYILDAGLTLNGYCRTHFFKVLEKFNANLISKYNELYRNPKSLERHTAEFHRKVLQYCQQYGITPYIPRPVTFYPKDLHINKRIAERFYVLARELQMSGHGGYRALAYRKAAWALDDLKESIRQVYMERGIVGIMELKGIGKSLASQIENLLKEGDSD